MEDGPLRDRRTDRDRHGTKKKRHRSPRKACIHPPTPKELTPVVTVGGEVVPLRRPGPTVTPGSKDWGDGVGTGRTPRRDGGSDDTRPVTRERGRQGRR